MEISKKKNGSKYLIFDLANENNEALKRYKELQDGIKSEIETIKGGNSSDRSSAEQDKDFMKIKLNSDDNLPLNKTLKLNNIIIVFRSVFEEHGIFQKEWILIK